MIDPAHILLLAGHFLRTFADAMNKDVRAIAPRALDQLSAHAWPGNVRELNNVIQRAVALAEGDTINSFAFAPAAGNPVAPAPGPDGATISIPIGTTVDDATKRLVQATIDQCAGNKLKAAQKLGISPRTMYRHFSNSEE
jgi:DNA-binding NtrC family response regulator